jgi:hypothetical protein
MSRGQAPSHGAKRQISAPLRSRRGRSRAPTVPNGRALGPGPWPWPRRTRTTYAATALGRRPRRATARPGMSPAQLSQRSACLAPRRASVNVSRSVAPFPSPTSLPQLSQTRTVLRAKAEPPFTGRLRRILAKSGEKFYAAARDSRMRHERSSDTSARSSGSRPISRAPTTRKWRGRKSSIVRPSRYCSTTAGLT